MYGDSGKPFNLTMNSSSSSSNDKRRSSRSIKRRKFDDELVESSLNAAGSSVLSKGSGRLKTHLGTSPSLSTPPASMKELDTTMGVFWPPEVNVSLTRCMQPPSKSMTSFPSTASTSANSGSTAPGFLTRKQSPSKSTTPFPSIASTSANSGTSASGSSRSRRKLNKQNVSASYKDMGRWKPVDDLLLIENVIHICDMKAVHLGTKFSCKFTLAELNNRWSALMYNSIVSKLALSAIENLQSETIARVLATCLYSEAEEESLASIKSTTEPSLKIFEDLLEKKRDVFHWGRTPKSLYEHWRLMKKYNLLSDQIGAEKPMTLPKLSGTEERNNALLNTFGKIPDTPLPKAESVLPFAVVEELLDSETPEFMKDPILDRISKMEMRMLEDELKQLKLACNAIPGGNSVEFDDGTLAVLRGQFVRYLMRSSEITLGRKTQNDEVDVDLSLEGPALKVSRRQATIRVKSNGEFYISNEGQRPIYVDGSPILTGDKSKLQNDSVLEIAELRFIFLINFEFLYSVLRLNVAQSPTSDTRTAQPSTSRS